MEQNSEVIFDRNVVEFVTVAAEYCAYLEDIKNKTRDEFVDTILKIMPLLYIKASLLPDVVSFDLEDPEVYVTEDIYEQMHMEIEKTLGEKDDYLDVFVQDMKYSDTPIKKNISEDLTDIYQDLKNFIFVFTQGINQTMNDSLALCQEHFKEYWGQVLVNTMRALHEIKYNTIEEE
jgi:hypothetical protein